MISRQEKEEIVSKIKQRVDGSCIAVVADYTGLSMEEFDNLRGALKKSSAECVVVKNTLAKLALKGTHYERLEDFLSGPSLLVLGKNDVSEAIKSLQSFQEKVKTKLIVKGGAMPDSEKPLSAKEVEAIGKLPPKEILLGQIAGALTATPSSIVNAINQVIGGIGELAVKVAEKQNK